MPIPSQGEAFRIALGVMTDGKQRTNKQIKEKALEELALTEEEKREKTSTGIPLWESRIEWGTQYLQRASLLERVKRGLYVVTDEGRKVYDSGLDGIELSRQIDAWIKERNPWNTGSESKKKLQQKSRNRVESDSSPEEQMDALQEKFNDALRRDLLDSILDRDPVFFEQLVVDLLGKMGYGDGKTTQYVGDGGIDGIVATDALGFDPIHIQAKRYSPGNKVGSPEIQKFAGALGSVTRGAFITTSTFTDEAKRTAKNYPHATIVLIDGEKLADLMIEYELGVTPDRIYRVKRIDGDYFRD